jgi:hypothetical protein
MVCALDADTAGPKPNALDVASYRRMRLGITIRQIKMNILNIRMKTN